VAQAAYRFHKLTDGQDVYDVRLSPAGHVECDCPGCTYHGEPCKHVKTLAAAGMLPKSVLQPTGTGAVIPQGRRRGIGWNEVIWDGERASKESRKNKLVKMVLPICGVLTSSAV
jgi:hypothetical protein